MFQVADGGTIFLDEIGDMGLLLQARILRALNGSNADITRQEVRPVGNPCVSFVDVRVITATNQDLAALMDERKFRADLYMRLKMLRISIPPLRERSEDIPALVAHFLQERKIIPPDVMGILQTYSWPGNVRELHGVVELGIAMATRRGANEIVAADLGALEEEGSISFSIPNGFSLIHHVIGVEGKFIQAALRKTGNNQVEAARILGITRDQFRYKMKKAGISP